MSDAFQPRIVVATAYSGTAGGTGKSTLSANLSAYLARYFPVMLIDLGIDSTYVSSQLHGVSLAQGEVGMVQAWLAALDGVFNPPQPIVKPSAKVSRVFVVPPGPITSRDLAVRSYSLKDAVSKLYSIIAGQARIYRTPFVLIDTPAGADVFNDLALFISDIAIVVLAASVGTRDRFDGIIARVGKILNKTNVFVVVNKETATIDLPSPFAETHHLPYSPEVEIYLQRNAIFTMFQPMSVSGKRWQSAFFNLAEAIARKAKELMGI